MALRVGTLDVPMIYLDGAGDAVTFRDLAQNVFVTGVTGGGKSSGPRNYLLRTLLTAGAGGIVLCAKPGEADEIRELCAAAGRLESLIVWNGRNHGFNFLGYMLAKLGADGVNSAVEYLMRIIEMVRAASALPAGNGDAFWLDELRVLIRHAAPIIYAVTGTLRIRDLIAFVRSAPTSPEQFSDPSWQQRSAFYRFVMAVGGKIDNASMQRIADYWKYEFACMDPKLRSNILAGFAMLDRFNHGWLADALTGDTTLVPALTFHAAVIVIDAPRATMGEDGIILQMIFKDAWQSDVLGRNGLAPVHRQRPVFCCADEYQEFATSTDADFLAMSRSSNASTIALTQSLPSIYAKLGGANARDRAHHLIANFGIKIFCANSCPETNEWAAKTLGRSLQSRGSYNESEGHNTSYGVNMGDGSNWGTSSGTGGSISFNSEQRGFTYGTSWNNGRSSGGNESRGRNRGEGSNSSVTHGHSMVMDYSVEPGAFARMLKTGGPANGNRVSAIWFQAGRQFRASGGNALLVEFAQ
jgi:TraM recognition site of TraD and TraG